MSEKIELYHADGKSAGVFYCPKCKNVYRTKDERCSACALTTCQVCGKTQTGLWYGQWCDDCWPTISAQREHEQFAKAEKINACDYTGWVFCDQANRYNNGYFESIEELREHFYCEEEPLPDYVYATYATSPNIDADSIIENILEDDMFEEADIHDLNGVAELGNAIKAFNDANINVLTHHQDTSKVILLPKED